MPRQDNETMSEPFLDPKEQLIHNKHAAVHEIKGKRRVLKTLALTMAFFCLGLCVAVPGPTLLDLGQRVNQDIEHMTFIFTARSVGFLIGSLVGGVLFDFFDQQILLFYTLAVVAVATAGVPWCSVLLTLSTMICLQGVAVGVLDTGGNIFCIKIWGKRSAPFMQVLHFAFGIGAFLAPLIARPFLMDRSLFHNTTSTGDHPVISLVSLSTHNQFIRDVSRGQYDHHNFIHDNYSINIQPEYSQTSVQKIKADHAQSYTNNYKPYIVHAWYTSQIWTPWKNIFYRKSENIVSDMNTNNIEVGSNSKGVNESRESITNINVERPSKPEFSEGSPLGQIYDSALLNDSKLKAVETIKLENTPIEETGRHVSNRLSINKNIESNQLENIHKEEAKRFDAINDLNKKYTSDLTIENKDLTIARVKRQSLNINEADRSENETDVTNESDKRKIETENVTDESDKSKNTANVTQMSEKKTTPSVPSTQKQIIPAPDARKPAYIASDHLSQNHADGGKVDSIIKDLRNKETQNKLGKPDENKNLNNTTKPVDKITNATQIGTKPVDKITNDTQIGTKPVDKVTNDTQIGTKPVDKIINATQVGTEHVPDPEIDRVSEKTTVVTGTVNSLLTTETTLSSTVVSTTTTMTITSAPTSETSSAETTAPPTQIKINPVTTQSTALPVAATVGVTAVNVFVATKPQTTGDLFRELVISLTGMSRVQIVYPVISFLLAINSCLFMFLHCKDRKLKSPFYIRRYHDPARNSYTKCFAALIIFLLFLFFLAYMGMEVTFGGLLATFAVNYQFTPVQGASLTSLFWGCLAVGRGFSIFIARCVKPSSMIIINLSLTVFGAFILSFGVPANPAVLWVGTVVFGLGMSSIFPTAISWANSCYPLSSSATAVFVAGNGVGEMTVPLLTGFLYENVNQMAVMYVVLFLSSLLSMLYFSIQIWVHWKSKSQQRSGFVRLKNLDEVEEESDMGVVEGISLGIMETTWRRRVHGEEDGKIDIGGKQIVEFTKLMEM